MANFLFKKSYKLSNFKRIKYDHLWGSKGVFTTIRLFGKDGAKQLSESKKIPFLGSLPLVQSVREASDFGRPAALQDNSFVADSFVVALNFAVVAVKYEPSSAD